MACCTGCGKLQQGSPGFTLQTGCLCSHMELSSVLEVAGGPVGMLGGCVDAVRDLYTEFGARQYEVRLVWTRWTGGQRGAGEEYVYRERLLQPTPRVRDLSAVKKTNMSLGLEEEGKIVVDELSPQLSEGDLLGLVGGQKVPADTNFYWEVRTPPREGGRDIRRRFFPASAPVLKETKFQWSITLVRAHGDRTPEGLPRGEAQ